MLRNYITTALRNLVRNRLYAAINIVGLAVGFAAALLIALFVRDELTYERWIPGYERTLLLTHTIRFGGVLRYDKSWSELASRLKLEFSEVESATRIVDEKVSLRVGDIEANEKIYWADANVFDVLPLPTIHG